MCTGTSNNTRSCLNTRKKDREIRCFWEYSWASYLTLTNGNPTTAHARVACECQFWYITESICLISLLCINIHKNIKFKENTDLCIILMTKVAFQDISDQLSNIWFSNIWSLREITDVRNINNPHSTICAYRNKIVSMKQIDRALGLLLIHLHGMCPSDSSEV